jgi:ribokinase
LSEPLDLPPAYRQPRAMHLITEFPAEPMVQTALALRERGTLFSLEPLVAGPTTPDWEGMLALIRRVDLVCPDWPAATRVAGSDDPKDVLRHWATLGPDLVAVRHGARGSYVWGRGLETMWHVPPPPVAVVDTTGAGNAYGGGLCVGWTETRDARLAGGYGAVSAATLIRQVGMPRMSAALRREARSMLAAALAATRPL